MSHSRRKQWIAPKWGRGYHRSGPTGWLPDRSGLMKVGEPDLLFKNPFSIARLFVIAAFALTSGQAVRQKRQERRG